MDLTVEIERNGRKTTYVTVAGRIKAAVAVNAAAKAAYELNTYLDSVGEDAYVVAEYSGLSASGAPCRTKARSKVLYGGYGPNRTNPVEVAETSAVGRALGFAGYGIDAGVASADEIEVATTVAAGVVPDVGVVDQSKKKALAEYVFGQCRKKGIRDSHAQEVLQCVLDRIESSVGVDVDRMSDDQAAYIRQNLREIIDGCVKAVMTRGLVTS